MNRVSMLGILLVLSGAISEAQTAPSSGAAVPAAPAGNVENGKKLYNAVGCWTCHGYSGQGGAGARIAPDPIPLPAFIRYVRTPTRSMPPYTAKVLKDSELADIHAYLKTLPKLPEPASIPLLKGGD
jgi:mono/diheme cytochrome c family protein